MTAPSSRPDSREHDIRQGLTTPPRPCLDCTHDYCACEERKVKGNAALSAVEAEVREAHNTVSLLETDLRRKEEAADRYRIEADCGLRDYDALELDAGLLVEALEKITRTVGIVTRTSDGVDLRTAPEYTGEGARRIAVEALASYHAAREDDVAPVSPSEPVPQQTEEERCSCGGIDAVPHATDHSPDCTIWGDLAEEQQAEEGGNDGA